MPEKIKWKQHQQGVNHRNTDNIYLLAYRQSDWKQLEKNKEILLLAQNNKKATTKTVFNYINWHSSRKDLHFLHDFFSFPLADNVMNGAADTQPA